MDKTTITCVSNSANAPANILDKNDRFMKVVLAAMTDMPISMHKKNINDAFYIGYAAGLEFISTGD